MSKKNKPTSFEEWKKYYFPNQTREEEESQLLEELINEEFSNLLKKLNKPVKKEYPINFIVQSLNI